MLEKCMIAKRLDKKLAIVTGAHVGTGLELVAELALRGCRVIMAGSDIKVLEAAKAKIIENYNPTTHAMNKCRNGDVVVKTFTPIDGDYLKPMQLDLGSFVSIGHFLNEVSTTYVCLDFLICNESYKTNSFAETTDGLELQMGCNHFGHYILIEGLMNLLRKAPLGKIIIHSSKVHAKGEHGSLEVDPVRFNGQKCFANSKLAQVMYGRYVDSELLNRNQKENSKNTVKVITIELEDITGQVQKSNMALLMGCGLVKRVNTPWDCVQNSLFGILDDNIQSGSYLVDSAKSQPAEAALELTKCQKLAIDTYNVISSFKSSTVVEPYLTFSK